MFLEIPLLKNKKKAVKLLLFFTTSHSPPYMISILKIIYLFRINFVVATHSIHNYWNVSFQIHLEPQTTSEYIRPLPAYFKRPEVTPRFYQEFLEPHQPVKRSPGHGQGRSEVVTPSSSQVGSEKILLSSDEEDYR